jgi:aminoglycoside phosphotransferase (APT) family kinase protein
VRDELRACVERRLGVDASAAREIDEGWDSVVFELEGSWIVRVPRRDEVREWLCREARLLPELASVLPVPVPRFEVLEDSDVFFVAYRRLPGEPLDPATPASLACRLGELLRSLHGFPRDRALELGVISFDAGSWLERQRVFAERCRRQVAPLLDPDERRRAKNMFGEFFAEWDQAVETVLIHGDLGPAHVLRQGRELTGVIDWSDACVGDSALDLAWALHGTQIEFAVALRESYPVDEAQFERALYYRRLGPWHEVLFGLERGRPELVESGLAGVRERLPE